MFHRTTNMSLIILNKNLMQCHLCHKKLGLQSLQISFTFKFNFIHKLYLALNRYYSQIQYTYLQFQINSAIQYNKYHINQQPLVHICSNSLQQVQTKFMEISLVNVKKIKVNSHSIVLTLLQ